MSEQGSDDADRVELFEYLTIFDEDVRYVPFVSSDGRVGYVVRSWSNNPLIDPQKEMFIYFNPRSRAGYASTLAGRHVKPEVFVYAGTGNDPALDQPWRWFEVDLDDFKVQG